MWNWNLMTRCSATLYDGIKREGVPEASDPGFRIDRGLICRIPAFPRKPLFFLPVETNIHSRAPAWAMPIYFFTLPDEHTFDEKNGGHFMKGYLTATGYMGYVDGRYVLFSSESDYREYVDEQD